MAKLFRFEAPYLLTHLVPGGVRDSRDIVVGVREARGPAPASDPSAREEPRRTWAWVSSDPHTGGGRGQHLVHGKVTKATPDMVLIRDQGFEGWARQPAMLRFDLLTHGLWTKLGKAGWIPGYAGLSKKIKDDAALHQHLVFALLPEWWREHEEEPAA